jgi:hypothetical protein
VFQLQIDQRELLLVAQRELQPLDLYLWSDERAQEALDL